METKYGSLRTVAEIIKIASFVVLFVGLYFTISFGMSESTYGLDPTMLIILSIFVTLLIFVSMLAASALIYVFLDTEENTRRSAEMLKEAQKDRVTRDL